MASLAWTNNYIGIPFKAHGRSLIDGCDCWGLARIIEKEHYEKELPSLDDTYGELIGKDLSELVYHRKILYEEHKTPVEGDLVLMRVLGNPCHIGVYVWDGFMLHSDPVGRGTSRIERLSSGRIAPYIEGYYSATTS